jgi:UDP-glucuronate 4-epimerase
MNILVTGCAGFIGFHLTKTLLNQGVEIIGLDNLNNYYDPILKERRLEQLKAHKNFKFLKVDICDTESIEFNLRSFKVSQIIHLAAQAGVRHSISNPRDYLNNNIIGFFNILEYARANSVEHLTYASTSSTYGANRMLPFAEKNHADHPIQFYAATKRANELMAHSYSCIYGLPTSGLRFFTVYGPWGRPDMALFTFTKNILADKEIDIFNHGKHIRDFTYVDDIVDGIIKVSQNSPKGNKDWDPINPDPSSSFAPFEVYNIGNSEPVELMTYVSLIEEFLDKKAKLNFLPLQRGDVENTISDISKISHLGYQPTTNVRAGVKSFLDWYIDYHGE